MTFLSQTDALKSLGSSRNLLNKLSGTPVSSSAPVRVIESVNDKDNESFPKENARDTLTTPTEVIEGVVVSDNDRSQILPNPIRGKKLGSSHVSEEVRLQIATDSLNGVEQVDIAHKYGITDRTVKSVVQDMRTGNGTEKFNTVVEGKKREISDYALSAMLQSLHVITPHKLEGLSAKDASLVAMQLSRTVSNLMPKETIVDNRTQLVIFAPGQKLVDDYEQVEV